MRHIIFAAAVALGAAITPAAASETFAGAAGLDRLETTYVRHNREHRLMEVERSMDRQDRWERRARYRDRDYRRGDGYGYGRRHGGPPPWAPAHGRRFHERSDRW